MTKEYARFVEKLLKKAKIIEVINDYSTVTISKTWDMYKNYPAIGGKIPRKFSLNNQWFYYRAKCPFEKEDRCGGDINIYKDANTYFCEHCKKGGNALNFIQDVEHVDYDKAVEILAKKYNMIVPKRDK